MLVIKLKVKNVDVELSMEEAKELYDELDTIFWNKNLFVKDNPWQEIPPVSCEAKS